MNPNRNFILCATDFSPPASDAATVAGKLAQLRGETLRLIHATEAPRAGVREILETRLDAEVERLQKSGAKVESLVLKGRLPSDELLTYIRAESPSLVVVGGSPKGSIDRWVLGSFSERIAEASPVPTLIVRDAAAFDSWDWTKARITMLLALDFNASSDVVIRWARQFQRAGPCDLIACHVNWRMPTAEESAVPSHVLQNPAAIQARLERELHRKMRDQMGDDSASVVVRPYFGDPGPCIVEIAGEKRAHLIAVGTHQRRGIHRLAQFSVSREVLHQSRMNVVCVPIATRFNPREAHIPDFRRVLVATDFSDLGNTAVPYACAACGIGGLVKIVHVAASRAPSKRGTGNGGLSALSERLRSLVPDEAEARCQPPEFEVLEDKNVADAICREAEQFGADMVCMASHGLGASRALHGSVTKAVLRRLRRPLLVIQRPED